MKFSHVKCDFCFLFRHRIELPYRRNLGAQIGKGRAHSATKRRQNSAEHSAHGVKLPSTKEAQFHRRSKEKNRIEIGQQLAENLSVL